MREAIAPPVPVPVPGTRPPRSRPRRSTARDRPAAERVAAGLRAAILDGELGPNAQVNQQRWADRLKVSRAALREGLKLLTSEQLLQHEAHRGYFVTAFDLMEVEEIYWLRIQVERQVLLSTRRPDEEEAAGLTIACHAALAAAAAGERPQRFAAERQLFFGIYGLSPHRFLRNEAVRLWDLAEAYRSMVTTLPPSRGPMFPSLKERRLAQLEAVLAGDRFSLAESVLGERRRMVASLNGTEGALEEGRSPMPLRWA